MTPLTLIRRLRTEQNPIKYLLSRLLWSSRLCALFTIHRDGYVLRFYPTSISAALWVNPTERTDDELILEEFLRAGDTYVDVGANIGTLVLKAARLVGETGTVHCFEANPRTYGFLVGNIRLNRVQEYVHAYNCALGAKPGVMRFATGRRDDVDHVMDDGSIEVLVRQLEDVLKDIARISFLKVDVEGYEIPVLQGAVRLLDRTDVIYAESFEPQLKRYGFRTRDLIEFLVNHGFSVYEEAHRGWRQLSTTHISTRCQNILAVSGRAADRVKRRVA